MNAQKASNQVLRPLATATTKHENASKSTPHDATVCL